MNGTLDLLPKEARDAMSAQWRADMGTPFNVTERLCRAVDAAAPAILAAEREQWEAGLLSDEVVEAVARIPWDNDFPGAWDKGVDPEDEEDRDPRPQARSDVRSCLRAALDSTKGTEEAAEVKRPLEEGFAPDTPMPARRRPKDSAPALTSEEATALVAAYFSEDHDSRSADAAIKRLGDWLDTEYGAKGTDHTEEGGS